MNIKNIKREDKTKSKVNSERGGGRKREERGEERGARGLEGGE